MLYDAIAETLWPTRCIICDMPGKLICDTCMLHLKYIDVLRACPYCGSPFGYIQCVHCSDPENGAILTHLDTCRSVGILQGEFARIVSVYKDQHELRLSEVIAAMLARNTPPAWKRACNIITTIPDTRAAQKRRGFDHMEPIAQSLSKRIGVPYFKTLNVAQTQDQRRIGRSERFANMSHAFSSSTVAPLPPHILLIDDVLTTGATLNAAACTLKQQGAQRVAGLTLARA